MNIKKVVLPVSIAMASLGGYSLATMPKEIQKSEEQTRIEQILGVEQEEAKPLMSKEAAWALTALGLGGLGAFSIAQIGGDYKEVRKTNKIVKEALKDKELAESVKKKLNTLIDSNNDVEHPQYELAAESLLNAIKNIRTDSSEKEEALSILRGSLKLNKTNMLSSERHDAVNRELPRLIYLIDKMTSTSEEWEIKRNNYPHYEKDTNADEYAQYAYKMGDLSVAIGNALKDKKLASFQCYCEKMKQELLQHSSGDDKAFAEALQGLYYLTSDVCARHFTTISDADGTRRDVNIALQKCIKPAEQKHHSVEQDTQRKVKRDIEDIEKLVALTSGRTTGTNKTKTVNSKVNPKITFDSVGGQDEVIDKLKKSIMFPLKYPEAFQNRMMNRGLLLYGRPGTGKTLLALALANESGVNFIKINASDLTESLHGKTEQNWRDVFEKARKQQPCIIFIDEFDSVGKQRGTNKVVDYGDDTLNQILALMSDVEKNGDNIFVIGATNRYDIIDSGAKRAGRFGTHIEVKAPQTVKEVLQIFDVHTKDKPLADDINKEDLAKMMLDKDVTGSDIAIIVNNAYENTYNRLGIYQKMDNGTYTKDDLKDCVISYNDFLNAIIDYQVP